MLTAVPAAPLGWGLREFTRAMQALTRQSEFYLLTEIQSEQLQIFWAFLCLSELLVWQREAVLPAQHLLRFSKREMCSK